jgi:PIN domain nuclease of toxin-antitoxin system
MRLLLDTCALQGSSKLSPGARAAIEDSRNDRFVSHATAWEIAVKASLGKLELKVPYNNLFPKMIDANGFLVLPPKFLHYNELLSLPMHHRDPFDRLLVAQSRVDGLTVVTSDTSFGAYGVTCLW